MNAGTLGLPSGQTGRRVTGLVRSATVISSLSPIATAARALQTSVTAPASDVNSLVLAASMSGRGQINWCGVGAGVGFSANLRGVLEVDGVIIYDATVAATVGNGLCIIGGGQDTSPANATFQPVQFQSGFRLLVAASVSGSTISGFVNAEVHA